MLHHFWDDIHPKGQGAITSREFVQIINFVGRQHILNADEWMRRVETNSLLATDVCLTFDDALLCQYDIAFPVLQELGITAFWFIYSGVFEGNLEPLEIYRYFRTTAFNTIDDFYEYFQKYVAEFHSVEYNKAMSSFDANNYLAAFPFYTPGDRLFRYLRDDVLGAARYHKLMNEIMNSKGFNIYELPELLWMNDKHLQNLHAAGHVIGLHSYSHPTRMADLGVQEQENEYRKNFNHIKSAVNESPVCVAHPCNSYSPDTLGVLKKLGLKFGFRSTMKRPDVPVSPQFEFAREDHANIIKEISQRELLKAN
jgi:peptidoglycan/xylan/chitin deacetylase (PgdA/CDA1 family)